MANYSKFLSLITGMDKTVDLSLNTSTLELGGGGLQMNGSTSGHLVITASATTSTYSMIWPSAQAVSSGYTLSNDGTGVLTWVPLATGSITAISVNSSNGFAGTSSGGTTPALTLTTTVTGVLKGNGTAISAASAGTDYVIPSGSITGTASNITGTSNSTLTTLSALTTASSLASVGTITSGVWNGSTVGPTFGGTGQSTYTTGDTIYASATNTLNKLGIGSAGQVYTVVGGVPAWATPSISPGSVSLATNHILVGNVSNVATDVAMSGDVSIVASGATSLVATTNSTITTLSALSLPTSQLSGSVSLTTQVSGILPVANGGSGVNTITTNGVVFGQGTSPVSATAAGTQYQVLQAGSGGVPTFGALNLAQAAAVTGILPNANTTATSANTNSAIVARDSSGNFSASTITASLTGHASLDLALTGGTMSGNIAMGSNKLTGLSAGTTAGDSVRYEQAVLVTGVNAFTAAQSMGGFKLTNLANGTASSDAATYGQVTSLLTGLNWLSPVSDPDLVDDSLSAPPITPVYSITYIIAASPTGAWATYAGHAVWWDGAGWVDLSTGNHLSSGLGTAVQVGDRFAVAIGTAGASAYVGGGLTGKTNDVVQVLTNTPGSITYTTTTPVAGYAVNVNNANSQHAGSSFTYNGSTSAWVDFSGPSKVVSGNALAYTGNTLNVLFDGVTIDLTSNQLEVKAGGISNTQIATAAAIARSKLASGTNYAFVTNSSAGVMQDTSVTASRAVATDSNGLPTASTTTATELGYVSGVTSAIQTQLNNKLTSTLTSTHIFVGNGSAVATDVAVSGDLTLANTGAFTVAKIQGTVVSSTTGSTNVVFSNAPTLTGLLSGGSASFSSTISASNFSGSSSGTNTGDQTITLTGPVTGSGTGSFATTITASAVGTTQLASAAVTPVKLGTITDGITLDQSGTGSTLEVKSLGISTTQLANSAVTPVKLGTITDGVTLDQSGTGSTLEIKSGGVGTTQLAAASVTATKLGSVTDGTTLDQSGAGSTIEIKAAGVSATQLATGAFDQTTITGGAGTAASVAYAPSLKRALTAGQSFSANTSYAVRWGLTANGETANRVYAADITTSSYNLFYVIGMASSGTAVSAGQTITVTSLGSFNLSSSDTAFGASTDGSPVFLTASGTFSLTAPSSAGQAVTRIGIVQFRSATVASNIIDVNPTPVGIN